VSVSREDASPSDEGTASTSTPSSSLATTSQEFADEEPERGEEVSGRATDALARAAIRDAMPCASRGEVWSPRVGEEISAFAHRNGRSRISASPEKADDTLRRLTESQKTRPDNASLGGEIQQQSTIRRTRRGRWEPEGRAASRLRVPRPQTGG
jgi:hypothetical protein